MQTLTDTLVDHASIKGWFDYADFYDDVLDHAPEPAHFVEMGAFHGRSFVHMAERILQTNKHVRLDVVDLWLYDHDYQEFLRNEQPYRDAGVTGTTTRVPSITAAESYADGSLNFVFIDGEHSYAAAKADIAAWLPKVKPGGILAGHDYCDQWPGVIQAVDEAFGNDVEKRSQRVWCQRVTTHAPTRRVVINGLKRVIAVLDLPPKQASANTVESYEDAAARWGAELVWIREPLQHCHPFWQKLYVCQRIRATHGDCHLLQLDNDMLIREDCPNIFQLATPDQFAFVCNTQWEQGNQMWSKHHYWAKRFAVAAAPGYLHPNAGLYLYGTAAFGGMFAYVADQGYRWKYDKRHLPDESIIINHLYKYHREQVKYLPQTFNVNTHQVQPPHTPAMGAYVYHFVGGNKHLANQMTSENVAVHHVPPEPNDNRALALIEVLRELPEVSLGAEVGVYRGTTAATLLAHFQDLTLYGIDTWDETVHSAGDLSGTLSGFVGLNSCIRNLRVNLRRWCPLRTRSDLAARMFDNASLDFVFIDAEHGYDSVIADLRAWSVKVKPSGLLIGHDYNQQFFPEVVKAVQDFAEQSGLAFQLHNESLYSFHVAN